MDREEQGWKTVKETAEVLKIPLTRCYELIHAGELPAVRIGERSIRVPARELERVLLGQHRVVEKLMPKEEILSRRDVEQANDLVRDTAEDDTSVSKPRHPSTK